MPNAQTEVMFDGGIPMLEGTWYDPKTGNSITVRDTLFEDNNLVILTTDGRRIPYSQMERYVKSDKPISKQPKVDPVITKKTFKQTNKVPEPATWDDLILDEDKDVFNSPMTSPQQRRFDANAVKKQSVEDQILEKALKRFDNDIKIDIIVTWGAKKSTLINLMDMFGFTEEDFANYLISKAKDIDLKEPMKEAVKCIIN